MASVFLSFAHDDQHAANQVADALRDHGVEVFDFASVPAGANISQAIDDGIDRADAVFFLISRNFARSDWANIEVGAAMAETLSGRTKLLVPVLIDRNVKPSVDVPSLLQRYQWLDLRDGIDAAVLADVAQSLSANSPTPAMTDQLDAEEALLALREAALESERLAYAAELAYGVRRERYAARAAFAIAAIGLALACVAVVGVSRGVDVAWLVAAGGAVGTALGSLATLVFGSRSRRISREGPRRDRRY